MRKKRYSSILYLALGAVIIASVLLTAVQARAVPLMTKEELKAMLGSPDLVILDVRSGKDWKSSEFKIKDAVRADPRKFESWSGTYGKDKQLVLYCA